MRTERGGLVRPQDAYRRGVALGTTVSPQAAELIDTLLATGLYGLNRSAFVREAVYAFLREKAFLRETEAQGSLNLPHPKRGGR